MNEELVNEKFKVVNHRLDDIEADNKEMKKEIRETSDLKFVIQNLSEVVTDLKQTVNEINSRDGKKWRDAKWVVVSGVIMSILSFILGKLW